MSPMKNLMIVKQIANSQKKEEDDNDDNDDNNHQALLSPQSGLRTMWQSSGFSGPKVAYKVKAASHTVINTAGKESSNRQSGPLLLLLFLLLLFLMV